MTLVRETFHQQIRQNKVRSILLMAAVIAIFAILFWFLGFYFVADPVNQFERILNHFDLQMTDALATHLRATVDPGRQQKWKRLDPEVVARCLPILEDEMATHGYTVPDEIELPSQT